MKDVIIDKGPLLFQSLDNDESLLNEIAAS